MNLSHLRYFVELAHTRHYTRAAEHLFITQPSLSHAIGQLESELGSPSSSAAAATPLSPGWGRSFWCARSAPSPPWTPGWSPCGAAPRGRG